MNIIAFTGAKTVGKTTVAKALQKRIEGSHVLSFATPLKAMASALGIPSEYIDVNKEETIPSICVSSRELLCSLGTDWGRNFLGQDVWVKFLELRANQLDPDCTIIIDDLRFNNEAEWVLQNGGIVFKLTREGKDYDYSHVTERPIRDELILYIADCDNVDECVEAVFCIHELQTDG